MIGGKILRNSSTEKRHVRFTEAIEVHELELSDSEKESKSKHWRQVKAMRKQMKVHCPIKLNNKKLY